MTFSLSEMLRLMFPAGSHLHEELVDEAVRLEELAEDIGDLQDCAVDEGIANEYVHLENVKWAISDHRMSWRTPNGWAPIYNPQALTFRTYAQAHEFAESGLVAQFPTAKPWPVRLLTQEVR